MASSFLFPPPSALHPFAPFVASNQLAHPAAHQTAGLMHYTPSSGSATYGCLPSPTACLSANMLHMNLDAGCASSQPSFSSFSPSSAPAASASFSMAKTQVAQDATALLEKLLFGDDPTAALADLYPLPRIEITPASAAQDNARIPLDAGCGAPDETQRSLPWDMLTIGLPTPCSSAHSGFSAVPFSTNHLAPPSPAWQLDMDLADVLSLPDSDVSSGGSGGDVSPTLTEPILARRPVAALSLQPVHGQSLSGGEEFDFAHPEAEELTEEGDSEQAAVEREGSDAHTRRLQRHRQLLLQRQQRRRKQHQQKRMHTTRDDEQEEDGLEEEKEMTVASRPRSASFSLADSCHAQPLAPRRGSLKASKSSSAMVPSLAAAAAAPQLKSRSSLSPTTATATQPGRSGSSRAGLKSSKSLATRRDSAPSSLSSSPVPRAISPVASTGATTLSVAAAQTVAEDDASPRVKRKYNKLKPERSRFASQEEYEAAFQAWRAHRDRNNRAVRKSRCLSLMRTRGDEEGEETAADE